MQWSTLLHCELFVGTTSFLLQSAVQRSGMLYSEIKFSGVQCLAVMCSSSALFYGHYNDIEWHNFINQVGRQCALHSLICRLLNYLYNIY